MALRRKMAAAVDQLLQAVDLLVAELDLDTPHPDREPSHASNACTYDAA